MSTRQYWEKRYRSGGTSGIGSYGRLAVFKAVVINGFVRKHNIRSVLELGCGDGNQLALARYPDYIGYDIASAAVERCHVLYGDDPGKRFHVYDPATYEVGPPESMADATMSIDVIYHLIEDDLYSLHMEHLFDSARRFVIIYSSDREEPYQGDHQRHHKFTEWIRYERPQWHLAEHVPNRYPYTPQETEETSHADFYLFQKK